MRDELRDSGGGGDELDLKQEAMLEACARAGILPKELESRTLESFAEANLDPAVQEVRYEHFVRKRREKMRIVLEEHDKIAHEEEMRIRAQKLARATADGSDEDAEAREAALLQKEHAQLERLKERQKQDIQQLLAYEVRMAQQHKENKAKMEREAKAKLDRERRRRERAAEEEARRARKEQERLELEREEERQRRILSAKEAKAAKLQAEMDRQQEIERRKESRRREEEQARRQQKRQEATRKIFEAQQSELLQKKREMDRKQRERESALAAKREQYARDHERKRSEQMQRVQLAMDNQDRLLEQQRQDFEKKQRSAQARQRAFNKRREKERLEALERAAEKAALIERTRQQMEQQAEQRRGRAEDLERHTAQRLLRRKMAQELENRQKARESSERDEARRRAYEQMIDAQQAKCAAIFRKRQQKEAAAARRAAREKTTNAVQEELVRLREQDRLELIERKRRMEEYKRKRIMDKIQREGERAAKIRDQREKLIELRKQQSLDAEKQKKEIVKTFEHMRATGKLVLPKEMRGMDLSLAASPTSAALPQVHSSRTPTEKTKPTLAQRESRPASAAPRPLAPGRPKGAHAVVYRNGSTDSPTSTFSAGKREADEPPREPKHPPSSQQQAWPTSSKRAPSSTRRAQGTRPRTAPVKKSPKPESPGHHGDRPKSKKAGGKLKDPRARLEEEIKALKRKQNMHLLSILEEEQTHERRRESLLRKTKSGKERKRLDQRFGHERAKASERIMRITHEHEQIMTVKVAELNRALAQQGYAAS